MIDLYKGLADKKILGRPIPETRSPIVTTCTGSGPTGARSGQCTTLGVGGCHLDPELDPGTLELGGLDPGTLKLGGLDPGIGGLDPGTLEVWGLDPRIGGLDPGIGGLDPKTLELGGLDLKNLGARTPKKE